MPQDSSPRSVAVLVTLLVIVGVVMIAVGLPEQTLLQRRLLQLYSVPLSGALALSVLHLVGQVPPRPANRLVLVVVGIANLFGLLLLTAGILFELDGLLPLGQAVMWLSLGSALIWFWPQVPRRPVGRTFGLRPIDDEE